MQCNPHIYYVNQIQLLSDLNLKKTPQLVELVEDNQVRTVLYLTLYSGPILHVKACPFIFDDVIFIAGCGGIHEFASR